MRIGINGFFLPQQGTGTGQYTRQLIDALAALDPPIDCEVYQPDTEVISGSHVLRAPFGARLHDLNKLWIEQVAFPHACRRDGLDVAHVPYFGPPLRPTVPTVVTVHDLIPLLLPGYARTPWVRVYNTLVSRAVKRAAQIITDSYASQADIVDRLHIPVDRVHVVYLATGGDGPVRDVTLLESVRDRYGLPGEYILYLGGFDRRKNLKALLAAYALLLRSEPKVPPLVIAGQLPAVDSELFPSPRRMARELGIERQVHFAGWVAEEDKRALYSGAQFFVFLSLYEGFGLMVLEAMSCGTPVIAVDSSSLPEIVGTAGLLVAPDNVAQAAEAMSRLLSDPVLRSDLSDRGLKRAAEFTWHRTAEQTAAVYRLARSAR